MSEISWWIFLLIGTIVFIAGIVVACVLSAKKNRKAFVIGAVIEFIASAILYVPVLMGDVTIGDAFNAGITSILKSISIMTGNGFDDAEIENTLLSNLYGIVRAIVGLCLMIFVTASVIESMERISLGIRFLLGKKNSNAIILTSCNEEAMAMAKSINDRNSYDNEVTLVYFAIEDDISKETLNKIKETGAIPVYKETVFVVTRLYNKAKKIDVFFLEDEKKNLENLDRQFSCEEFFERIIGAKKGNRKKGSFKDEAEKKINFFVCISSIPLYKHTKYIENRVREYLNKRKVSNETEVKNLIEVAKEKTSVRFINVNQIEACNILREHSIFTLVGFDSGKDLNILIVGTSPLSREMFNEILALGQMPGYRLHLDVIDDHQFAEDVRIFMPEIKVGEPYNKPGDAIYEIQFYDDLAKYYEVNKNKNISYVFISTGDDYKNIKLSNLISGKVSSFYIEKGYQFNQINVPIVVEISNESIAGWMKDVDANNNIKIIGTRSNVYFYDNLSSSKLERLAKAYNDVKYFPKHEEQWNKYVGDDYNRNNIFERALSIKEKVNLLKDKTVDYSELCSEEWEVAEHMRYNMQQRIRGYSRPEGKLREKYYNIIEKKDTDNKSELRDRTMTNDCLVEYDMLHEKYRNNSSDKIDLFGIEKLDNPQINKAELRQKVFALAEELDIPEEKIPEKIRI